MKRGDIFWEDFPGSEGHVQGYKRRPWVIVQNDKGNAHARTTIVCPITAKDKPPLPTHVRVDGEKIHGTILCEQVRIVDMEEWEVVERLDEETIKNLDRALAVSVGINYDETISRIYKNTQQIVD